MRGVRRVRVFYVVCGVRGVCGICLEALVIHRRSRPCFEAPLQTRFPFYAKTGCLKPQEAFQDIPENRREPRPTCVVVVVVVVVVASSL